MSEKDHSEERFPLLLLFLEDGHRSSKQNKRIIFDKSRYQGITSGAATIITQWSNHITCWLTSLLIGLTMILIAMMMLAASLNRREHSLMKRCHIEHLYNSKNCNGTVYLVHGSNIWLQSQINFLEEIVKNYREIDINLIIIHNQSYGSFNKYSTKKFYTNKFIKNDTEDVTSKFTNVIVNDSFNNSDRRVNLTVGKDNTKNIRKKRQYDKNLELNIHIGARDILDILLNRGKPFQSFIMHEPIVQRKTRVYKTLEDLMVLYPNIHVINTTFEDIFLTTPLRNTWKNMNRQTCLFAVRVLQIWNFGGITFDIPEVYNIGNENSDNSTLSVENRIEESVDKFRKLANAGSLYYHKLPEGLVTVDENGFHMETKTICHAFFGDVLMQLKKAKNTTLPKNIIKEILFNFCQRSVVDAEYCRKIGIR